MKRFGPRGNSIASVFLLHSNNCSTRHLHFTPRGLLAVFSDLTSTWSGVCVPTRRHHVQTHHINTWRWVLVLPSTPSLVDSLRANMEYERKAKLGVSSRLHAQQWETGKTRGTGGIVITDEPSLVLHTAGKDGPGKL